MGLNDQTVLVFPWKIVLAGAVLLGAALIIFLFVENKSKATKIILLALAGFLVIAIFWTQELSLFQIVSPGSAIMTPNIAT